MDRDTCKNRLRRRAAAKNLSPLGGLIMTRQLARPTPTQKHQGIGGRHSHGEVVPKSLSFAGFVHVFVVRSALLPGTSLT
eukprot:4650905-Amphidinium_carterae.1